MAPLENLRIIRFQAQDILRLKAVEITPKGDLVVVGGKNDAGKTSVLDAITMAMGGGDLTPPEPVRRGAKAGRVVLDLGEIVVTLSIGKNSGRKLVVSNKEGAVFKSPQAMLDKLWGSLTFDPLAFERMSDKQQAEELRRMVGLDTSDLDAKRQRLYDERTEVNRSVKALQVAADSAVVYPDAPAEEVSIAELVEALDVAGAAVQAHTKAEGVLERGRSMLAGIQNELATLRKRIADLEAAEAETQSTIDVQEVVVAEARALLVDPEPIRAKLRDAEGLNEQVRTNRRHAQAEAAVAEAQRDADALTHKIDAIDNERLARLAAVAMPVDGLGIVDEYVTLNGLPFAQASTSDRIRTSLAIGLAARPDGFRVALVRDGSLLGPAKIEMIAKMAADANVQVWLEMLQEEPDARTSVFIEDGAVKA